MKLTVAVLAGDGIGPEITREACRVLKAVAKRYDHTLTLEHGLIGGAAIDAAAHGVQDTPVPRVGALDVLAQHVLGVACAAPFHAASDTHMRCMVAGREPSAEGQAAHHGPRQQSRRAAP